MYKIRFLKDLNYDVTITSFTLEDGAKVTTQRRIVNQDKMVPAEDVFKNEFGQYVIQWNEYEMSILENDDIEIHNWEPDNTLNIGGCCNHG